MKMIVLDGHTLNPGDQDWDGLQKLGELVVYDRTPKALVQERCAGATVVFTNKTPIDIEMENLPMLKYIGVLATGYNIVDTERAKKKGIVVTNAPGYGTDSVVQLTFALILELCLHVQKHSDSVSDGQWSASPDFSFWNFPLTELSGKTLGIIGLGHIGGKVADVGAAFGMKTIASGRNHSPQPQRTDFQWQPVESLLEQSDVVSIHCPLTPDTRGLIHENNLRRMKRSAFLINTSRGPLIVEKDLANALNADRIGGAGLDVLSQEPPPADNPLLHAKNCIITPHIAWATVEARRRLMQITICNLTSFQNGKIINCVNS